MTLDERGFATPSVKLADLLERLWIVEPLPAWLPTRNRLARLSQAPKHHLADPALATRLLGLDAAGITASALSMIRTGDTAPASN